MCTNIEHPNTDDTQPIIEVTSEEGNSRTRRNVIIGIAMACLFIGAAIGIGLYVLGTKGKLAFNFARHVLKDKAQRHLLPPLA